MDRRSAFVVLAVIGAGVFLAGLELMVTAVALPSILTDLADPNSGSAWIELRKASWIINGYLLVYILTMPMAGRLADLWGTRRLFMGALVVFTIGSALAGAAQTMDQLIAARVVQALGGGVLVPVGTAAAAHLFGGAARPRALGVVGALTFLGMAAGPVVGAAIIGSVHPEAALAAAGITGPLADILQPAWRWVFYLNVPIGIIALTLAWAAAPDWESPRRPGRVDILGAAWFGLALVAGLVGLTLLGSTEVAATSLDPRVVTVGLLAVAVLASVIAVVHGLRRDDPFLDPRLFRSIPFSSAALVSLLTGYAFATAIIGGAVFVDRVLYGGPDQQRLALGALAGATALGALASGFRRAGRAAPARGGGRPPAEHRRPGVDVVVDAGVDHRVRGSRAGRLRVRLRAHRDAALDGRRGSRRAACVRHGVRCRHGRPDAGNGDRSGHPDGLRLDDDRPPLCPGLRQLRRLPAVHPGGAP